MGWHFPTGSEMFSVLLHGGQRIGFYLFIMFCLGMFRDISLEH